MSHCNLVYHLLCASTLSFISLSGSPIKTAKEIGMTDTIRSKLALGAKLLWTFVITTRWANSSMPSFTYPDVKRGRNICAALKR